MSESKLQMLGGVAGGVRCILRLEGAAVLMLMVILYGMYGGEWWLFAALFLAPDIALLGYVVGEKTGSVAYNFTHSYVGPLAVIGFLTLLGDKMLIGFPIIWAAHIGFDRLLGYGLKYGADHNFTHLGPVGKARDEEGAKSLLKKRPRSENQKAEFALLNK